MDDHRNYRKVKRGICTGPVCLIGFVWVGKRYRDDRSGGNRLSTTITARVSFKHVNVETVALQKTPHNQLQLAMWDAPLCVHTENSGIFR